jgi:predicted 2-oxoglutarate/Fe(II)-dependent dioxygenase YbiX
MPLIKLYENNGKYVRDVELPLHQRQPDAIMVGERVFFKKQINDKDEYREGTLVVVHEEKEKPK